MTDAVAMQPDARICAKCLTRYPPQHTYCAQDGAPLLPLEVDDEDARLGGLVDGRYLVLGQIGRGGMGSVYRAWQRITARPVALKILTGYPLGGEVVVERFYREVRVTASLRSPHVVTIHDAGTCEDGAPYLVMELLCGSNLQTLLRERERLSAKETRDIGYQVCLGLDEAHAIGLVHRDLKPANIMVERSIDAKNHVKLLDFGLAKLLNAEGTRLTRTGVTLGTATYMAPEQADNQGEVSPASDIYALGVILFECLAGRVPFSGQSALHTMLQHRQAPPPHLTEVIGVTAASAAFERVILRCLAKAPAGRYASVVALREALLEIPVRDSDRSSARELAPRRDRTTRQLPPIDPQGETKSEATDHGAPRPTRP